MTGVTVADVDSKCNVALAGCQFFGGKGEGEHTFRANTGTNIADHSNKRLLVITRDFVVGRLNNPYTASKKSPPCSIIFASPTARSRPTWHLCRSTTTSQGQVSGST